MPVLSRRRKGLRGLTLRGHPISMVRKAQRLQMQVQYHLLQKRFERIDKKLKRLLERVDTGANPARLLVIRIEQYQAVIELYEILLKQAIVSYRLDDWNSHTPKEKYQMKIFRGEVRQLIDSLKEARHQNEKQWHNLVGRKLSPK